MKGNRSVFQRETPPEIELPQRYNMTVHFLDRHLTEGRANKTAVICEGSEISYGSLLQEVNRVGNGLKALGVEEERRVLLLLPDSPEFVASYFGAIRIGGVAVPTNTALRAPDFAYFLDESRARVLIVHSTFWDRVEPILEGRPYLRHLVVCGERKPGHLHWPEWLAGCSPDLQPAPTSRDDVAFWLWTSGSTGSPKAAVHLHRDWIYCCESYARGVLQIREDDRTFSSSKLFHAYGLGNALIFPFHVGATTVLFPGRPEAGVILQKCADSRATLFFSVPTLYAAMLQETDRDHLYDLSAVRVAVSAAEPLPAEIFRRWHNRFGIEVLDGIGSTEVLHIYASARAGRIVPGSTGQPVPGYEIRITDEEARPVAPGQIGDLWVKGESTALSYWNRSQLTRERMCGEWFFSGDKFRFDENGYLWYAGRCDDMIRVSGQWLSPIEVESTLVEHPAVLESAVVSYKDENELLKPKAFVKLKEGWVGDKKLIQELQGFVKERLSPYKYPRRIEFLEELPKTVAGKIQRFKLRESEKRTSPP